VTPGFGGAKTESHARSDDLDSLERVDG
jgi:hypothetical protein